MTSRMLKCSALMLRRQYSSSLLYLTGNKKQKQVSAVSPNTDFDGRFSDLAELEKNVKARKLDINVQKLHELWLILKHVYHDKAVLERRRSEIASKIKEYEDGGKIELAEKFKHQGKLLRDDIKMLINTMWDMEEKVITSALNLPNYLHSDTPKEAEMLLFENDKCVDDGSESHLEIGQKFNLIEWENGSTFYLKNNASLYEMHIARNISHLLKKSQYIEVSNSDFVRSVVLEGCGLSYDHPLISFQLNKAQDSVDRNYTHLVGSASLPSFCSLHSRHFVSVDDLPLKYVTIGRQYKPLNDSVEHGLFSTCQTVAVGVFVASSSSSITMNEFTSLKATLINFYKQFNYHFRVIYVPAHELSIFESLRVSFQFYSPSLKTYIEVGHLSVCGSFISKRLQMCYQNAKQEYGYLNILSGIVLSTTRFLGCAIENDHCKNEKLVDPERIRFN